MQVTMIGGNITEVRSALLRIAFPPNAKIMNLSGKTVMPGLINGHGHLGLVRGTSVSPANYTRDNIEHQLEQYERYGVTTTISLGMNKDLLYQLRSEQADGKLGGATILTADRGIGTPNGMPPVKVGGDQLYRPATPDEVRKDVDEMAARHPDLIKIWIDDNLGKLPKQKPEVDAAAIQETHKQGLRIAAHVFYQADAKQLLGDGLDIIAHSVRDSQLDSETVQAIQSKRVYYIPTLQLEESFYGYADRPDWMDTAFFKNALSPELAKELASPEYQSKIKSDPSMPIHKQAMAMAKLNVKKLATAGALVAFGTDSGANPYRLQGFAEHRELQLMVEAGLTPLQAIHSATGVNAAMLGIEAKTGTVAKGKRADLLVLDADPTQDIENSEKIHMIFHGGKQITPVRSD